MVSNTITQEEFSQFKSLSRKKKVDSMEAYLIGVSGRRYNMQEVGAMVFGDENYSFTVSLIHRCYNFSGQNGGRYRNGCRFEQTYGYRVTRKDIEAFVKQYPNGTFSNGVTFDEFLTARANRARSVPAPSQRRSVPTPKEQKSPPLVDYQNYNYQPSGDNRFLLIAMGSISVLILLFLLMTGGLFKHWIISLIALSVAVGIFNLWKSL